MKVAFVTTVYAPNEIGGAERTVRTLAEALVKHGHEAVVISLDPQRRRLTRMVGGVRVHYLPLHNLYWPYGAPRRAAWKRMIWHSVDAFNPAMGLALARVLRHERPDLVQMGNLQGFSASAWLAARWQKLPVVQMLHDYYLGCPNAAMFKQGANCDGRCTSCRVMSAPRRALSNIPHTVISLSRRTLQKLEQVGLFPGVEHKVILHGACDMHSAPVARADKVPGAPLVLGYLGRLEPIKGIELLLDAVAGLPSQRVRVLLGGKGTEPYLAALRQRSGPGSRVEFLGFVPPAEFFARIDALVVPSLWEEPLGRVIYEAYHHGVPAIVASSGGMPEIVDHGRSGFVFRAGDARDLRQLLESQLARGWRGAQFAEACVAKAREFSIDQMYPHYLDVWRRAAAQGTASPPRPSARSCPPGSAAAYSEPGRTISRALPLAR